MQGGISLTGNMRISACIIMRDAAEDIGECLESLVGLVDEFIVVDTGSKDNSREIAAKYAGKVYEFPWRDDFSAAKNYAIEQATGDWIVFLDSDEALTEDTRQNLRAVISLVAAQGTSDGVLVHRYNVRSDSREPVYEEDDSERIFRRDPALRYRYPIHECLHFTDGRELQETVVPSNLLAIWHKGYSPERLERKSRRNIRLLEEFRATGKPKPFLYYYLATEYGDIGEYEKMAEYAEISIRQGEAPGGDAFFPYRRLYEARQHMGDEEGTLRALGQAMEKFPKHPEFFAAYGKLLETKGRHAEALAALQRAARNAKSFGDCHLKWMGRLSELYEEMAGICFRMGNPSRAKSFRRKAEKERKKEEVS